MEKVPFWLAVRVDIYLCFPGLPKAAIHIENPIQDVIFKVIITSDADPVPICYWKSRIRIWATQKYRILIWILLRYVFLIMKTKSIFNAFYHLLTL